MRSIKLSKLEAALTNEKNPYIRQGWVANIEIDKLVFVKSKIKNYGFLGQADLDGKLTDLVMDVVCHHLIDGADVIVEIPAEKDFDLSALLQYAATTKFHISLLPPKKPSSHAAWKSYGDRLCHVTTEFFKYKNYSTFLNPITGYIHYIMCSNLGYLPDSITDDTYTYERFVKGFPQKRMDKIKALLHPSIMEHFNGPAGLTSLLNDLSLGMTQRMEQLGQERIIHRGFGNITQDKLEGSKKTTTAIEHKK